MMPEKSVKREQFNQAKQQWNLERLYNNLASIKGKMLTPMERLHLRGLLCGYSPTEIAERLHKEVRGVETDLSATIYQYVKGLVNKKIENWKLDQRIETTRASRPDLFKKYLMRKLSGD